MSENQNFKVKDLSGPASLSAFAAYREMYYGRQPLGRVILSELIITLLGGIGGALGLLLRSKAYPLLFASCGRKVVFGRNITLRHSHKIRIGQGVIIDDNCVLDAKGADNAGIVLGDQVYIGRNTIIYCKNGDITIGDRVNLSSNCQVYSSNKLAFEPDTMVGAYSYFLSGGAYDLSDPTPFSRQSGMSAKGDLTIGENCWIAARVTVLNAACIGKHCVVGAGAVVTKPIPANSVAVGVPAKVVKNLPATTGTS
ncbi:MAG: acyltransferase [Lentisphaerota bacterium]